MENSGDEVGTTDVVAFEATGVTIGFAIDRAHETVWGTQKQMSEIFDTTSQNIGKHLKAIFESGELDPKATTNKKIQLQNEGGRDVRREVVEYNLDVILSIGYRVNSKEATRFRQWANATLKQVIIEGYFADEDRLRAKPDAVEQLARLVRKLRNEEISLYQTVKDVFKHAASDYDEDSQAVRSFFAMAQDKFHYAVTQKTAAQIVLDRVSAAKPGCGLLTIKGMVPTLAESKVAKNYLTPDELEGLENICEQFILFAKSKAFRGQRMTMEELSTKLNLLLMANDYPVLYEYKEYLRDKANEKATEEVKKYRHALDARPAKPLPNAVR